ncbi:MAG: hypothetical protein L6367_00345 [Cellulomonas sp.]|nr:hypothetical protein [Cellulomonas sp.]
MSTAPHAPHALQSSGLRDAAGPVAAQPRNPATGVAAEPQQAVERSHPGRAAGVALGAVGLLLGVLVGLAALAASAIDLVTWTLSGS